MPFLSDGGWVGWGAMGMITFLSTATPMSNTHVQYHSIYCIHIFMNILAYIIPREEYQGTFARAFCREWPMKCNCLNLQHADLPKINGNKSTKCNGKSLQNAQAICSARRENKVTVSKNLEKWWKKSSFYKMHLPSWSEKYLATMGWTYKMLSYLKMDPEEKKRMKTYGTGKRHMCKFQRYTGKFDIIW